MKAIITIIFTQFIFSASFLNAQINYEAFEGKEVKTSIELKLKNVFFKEYGNVSLDKFEEFYIKDESLNFGSPENVAKALYSIDNLKFYKKLFIDEPYQISAEKLNDRKISDTLKVGVRLVHRLTFDYRNETLSFLKLKELKDSIPVATKIIAFKKEKDNLWRIVNKTSFSDIEFVIKKIKTRAFWEFFNRIDNEEYPIINKLKPLVQDNNKILDIGKLADVLKSNDKILKSYLD